MNYGQRHTRGQLLKSRLSKISILHEHTGLLTFARRSRMSHPTILGSNIHQQPSDILKLPLLLQQDLLNPPSDPPPTPPPPPPVDSDSSGVDLSPAPRAGTASAEKSPFLPKRPGPIPTPPPHHAGLRRCSNAWLISGTVRNHKSISSQHINYFPTHFPNHELFPTRLYLPYICSLVE